MRTSSSFPRRPRRLVAVFVFGLLAFALLACGLPRPARAQAPPSPSTDARPTPPPPHPADPASPPPPDAASPPPHPAWPASPPQPETDDRARRLEERVRQLEARLLAVPPASTPPSRPTVSISPLASVWKDGFNVQTDDAGFRLHVGGAVQLDGRYFPGNTLAGPVDGFLLRRARIDVEGTVWRYVNFRVLPDFAGGKVVLFDAYTEIAFAPWMRLRGGKFKLPFGLEPLQNEFATAFVERSFVAGLSPNRDLGVMLHGEVASGAFNYAAAVVNGNPDNSTNDVEVNDYVEAVGRVFAHPFRPTRIAALQQLGVGGAFTYTSAKGSLANPDLPTDKTDGQNTFFTYATSSSPAATLDDVTVAAGARVRATAQAYYYWRRLGVMGEYVWNRGLVQRKSARSAIARQAAQGYVTLLLTDDRASYGGVRPRRPVGLGRGFAGAWELGFRYSGEWIDEAAFIDNVAGDATTVFADPTKAARRAQSYTGGLNWYLDTNTKVQLDYVRTDFWAGAKGGNRPSENLLVGRLQYAL